MPDVILQVWKIVLLAFLYLFFFRVLRAIWINLRSSTSPHTQQQGSMSSGMPQSGPPANQTFGSTEKTKGVNRLRVLEPREQAGKTFDIDHELTIGRAQGCKIFIDDTFVSQLHARIYRRGPDVYAEDLGSTNGTFYNGTKLTGPVVMQKGDTIQVGQTVLEAIR